MKQVNNRQKMAHRQKQRLARKKMTKEEIVNKAPIFQTEYWDDRKKKIEEKVERAIQNRKFKKELRQINE